MWILEIHQCNRDSSRVQIQWTIIWCFTARKCGYCQGQRAQSWRLSFPLWYYISDAALQESVLPDCTAIQTWCRWQEKLSMWNVNSQKSFSPLWHTYNSSNLHAGAFIPIPLFWLGMTYCGSSVEGKLQVRLTQRPGINIVPFLHAQRRTCPPTLVWSNHVCISLCLYWKLESCAHIAVPEKSAAGYDRLHRSAL